MIFAFRRTALRHEDPCRPGRNFRFHPFVPVLVIGPSGRLTCQMLVDSGSAGTVLPAAAAIDLGIHDFRATGALTGVGSSPAARLSIRYAEVQLRIQQGDEACQWRAVVGFADAPLTVEGIFGVSGGLEYFHTTLDLFAN